MVGGGAGVLVGGLSVGLAEGVGEYVLVGDEVAVEVDVMVEIWLFTEVAVGLERCVGVVSWPCWLVSRVGPVMGMPAVPLAIAEGLPWPSSEAALRPLSSD